MIKSLYLIAALLVGGAVLADEAYQPDQRQLTELLSGNSLEGIWDGRPYQRYFDPGGLTLYRERDGDETEGRWRIDASGEYCSIWPPSDRWVCYEVTVIGNSIYWRSGGEYYPSEIKPGKIF